MQSLQDHFLIAMPAMADPNFTETVTYICKHDAEGAFGIVINRPSDLSLGEMLGQLAIDLEDRTPRGAARDAWRPRRTRARLRAAPLRAQPFEATLARRPRDRSSRRRPTSWPRSVAASAPIPCSSRSAMRAGAAVSSRSSSAATRGSRCRPNPAIIFETPFEQRWTAALGLPGVDIRRITHYAGHA